MTDPPLPFEPLRYPIMHALLEAQERGAEVTVFLVGGHTFTGKVTAVIAEVVYLESARDQLAAWPEYIAGVAQSKR